MVPTAKGRSPFYPGQPVPVELFVGRKEQIEHILQRGVGQVELGKPVAMYVQGEYGIGKSSVAEFVQSLTDRKLTEQKQGLHTIYAPLGSAKSLDDVGAAVLEATIRSGALDVTRSEKVRSWLAKYIGEQTPSAFGFGITIHAEELKKDAPHIAHGILPFLTQVVSRLQETGVRGVFLVLDEINGIANNPDFARLIKGIVDTNAISHAPLPLLLMLCGVEENRRKMIRHHQPVDRIFDVLTIEPMRETESHEFFTRAFDSVQMKLEPEARKILAHYSAGFPKIMHLIGDAAYWLDRDSRVDKEDALLAVVVAAKEVGEKYVDQQVTKALRSADYQSILKKIAKFDAEQMNFMKSEVVSGLTETEKRKFNNFLQKMQKLKVLRKGDVTGEYIFNSRMVRLYLWLQSQP